MVVALLSGAMARAGAGAGEGTPASSGVTQSKVVWIENS